MFYSYNTLHTNKKKEHAINLRQKHFNLYDTLYNNKQKGTSKKFALEIFSLF